MKDNIHKVLLSVAIRPLRLSVIMLSVIMLSVIMLGVLAPLAYPNEEKKKVLTRTKTSDIFNFRSGQHKWFKPFFT
jgi:hypothetical protein